MKKVKVFKVNEYDSVAAESLKQAKEWYMKVTGLNEEDAFYDFEAEVYPLDHLIWTDESRTEKQTLKSVIEEQWEGNPFIAFSQEW